MRKVNANLEMPKLKNFKSESEMDKALLAHLCKIGIKVEAVKTKEDLKDKGWYINVNDRKGVMVLGKLKNE